MNICVLASENNSYPETFIRAHINRLPGQTTFLYGGFFPLFKATGEPLVKPPRFFERLKWFFLSRFFKIYFSEDQAKHKAFIQFLIDHKIDAVLAEYGPTGANVMNACQEAGVSLIVHFHGFDAYRLSTLREYHEQYQKMFQMADAIVVVSLHMEKKLLTLGAPREKLHYNPCGMDEDMFFGAEPEKAPPTFLTTGRFVDKKGPHLTLLAFKEVLNKVPEAKLIMVGDGVLLDACMSLAKALKIEESVNFAGVQSHEQVSELMRQVRAFVQHSITPDSGDSEGTPVAVMEAGGAGLPVISTFHAGIPDVIIDGVTGFLVKECDVETMADRMIKVAKDPQLAGQMGKAAQKRVLAQFTLEKTIAKLASIIEAAVNK